MPATAAELVAEATSPEEARTADEVARLFELSRDLLSTTNREGYFTRLNPAWERALGWTREELMSRPAIEFVHTADVSRTRALAGRFPQPTTELYDFENRYLCKNGGYRWLQWNACRWGETWYAVARDVTERKRLEQQALQDPLTGLPNRTAFVDRLRQALERLERRTGLVAVLFVDLDRFKLINDGKGHELGDRFLGAVATRLGQTIRRPDTVARFGGDEFVILAEHGPDAGGVVALAERVVAAFDEPFAVNGDQLHSSASVGIAVSGEPDAVPETLLREADVAMYRAKARGGARCDLFDDGMRVQVQERVRVQSELHRALSEGELRLCYQPIVSLPETSVTRCEALVRWEHPDRGLLLPEDFIPLAEETGLIVPLGEWVLGEACRQAQAWRGDKHDIGVTVNVSTRQLADPGLADQVGGALAGSGLPASSLCLEITETAMMERPDEVAPALDALKQLGVKVAMDDFGSGYSSLTFLKSLPLDIIKIDKSFVAGIPTSAEDRAIVTAILNLARDTERSVIAEGVENATLHSQLVGLGCELGQGFLYDVPKPADQLELDGYSSRIQPGVGDPLVIREFMRHIGIPARIQP